jgi:D-beta-D-heptose 7-phosphate kinase / D-beta-D-heptose 1-phosphate adenosyltransferase
MNSDLPGLIDRFAGLNVLVIGEAMLDSYLEGTATRLAHEAPVPVVALDHRIDVPGGAANAAAGVAALGGSVTLLSVIGDDDEGRWLLCCLEERRVITDHMIVDHRRRTLAKQRVVAGGQILLRFDQGSTSPVDPATEEVLLDRLTALVPHCDAVIVSDYAYGILTPRLIETLGRLQAQAPRLLVVDARDLPAYRAAGVTVVKPNYQEAARLLGLPEVAGPRQRAAQIGLDAGRLLDLTGAQLAAVTMDEDGALFLERGAPVYRTFARPGSRSRSAGAGDTFVGALTLALAAGANTPTAAELASAAAAVVIEKERTATCTAAELGEYLWSGAKLIPDLARLSARIAYHRDQRRRIVFTNGCFDILHRGHITYLNRAKALGDVLVVGLNTDASVRRLKGPERPINPLEDRVQVLAALSCVDYIVPFGEDTPERLIRAVRPDLFVKGGDYTRETLPEADLVEALGGCVQILPYLEDRSTSEIVARIRAANAAEGVV